MKNTFPPVEVPGFDASPLFDVPAIQERLAQLAAAINRDYAGETLIVVGVLKGAFMFLADLVRHLAMPLEIEFIGCSSYAGTESTGHVRITHDLSSDVKDRHVLLVEDIIDTGRTMDYLIDMLGLREPKSVRMCALLSKPEAHQMRHAVDYVGFEISKEFVVGYGLDLDGRFRELPYIVQLKPLA